MMTTETQLEPVIVNVYGGVAQDVFTAEGQDYYVLDWDNLKGGDTVPRDIAEMYVKRGACTWDEIEPYVVSPSTVVKGGAP
jgi:hypothetical protein